MPSNLVRSLPNFGRALRENMAKAEKNVNRKICSRYQALLQWLKKEK